MSPSGKAVDFDSAIRRFESCYPSRKENLLTRIEEMATRIQFIKGLDETVIPDVGLTRSRDGSTGTATFRFKSPDILNQSTTKKGEITGMYLIDDEGIIETRDITAKFINGKPEIIESIYIMKNPETWNRFMRFMKVYSKNNGLVFIKAL